MARPLLSPSGARRPRASTRGVVLLAGVVVVLIVVAIAALYTVVPGDPEPVDEAVGGADVRAYEDRPPAPTLPTPAP